MDTSETIAGRRKRAPSEGVMDSGILAQSMGGKCRAGDPHLSFDAHKEVLKEQALWRHSEMTEKIDTQSRKDLAVHVDMDGGGFCVAYAGFRRAGRSFGTALAGGRGATAWGLGELGEVAGIGCVETVRSLFTCEGGRPDPGYYGYTVGVNSERGGRQGDGEGSSRSLGPLGSGSLGLQC